VIVTYRCDDCRTVFTPRAACLPMPSALRTEEMWRVTKGGQLMICELHTGDRAGASCEVVIKRDGEWLFGRLCPERSFARYVAHALKHDHLKSGWVESYGARIAGACAEAAMTETNRPDFDQDGKQLAPNEQTPESDERDAQPADDDEEFEDESDETEEDEDETDESEETAS
jgi:hypothetical protein